MRDDQMIGKLNVAKYHQSVRTLLVLPLLLTACALTHLVGTLVLQQLTLDQQFSCRCPASSRTYLRLHIRRAPLVYMLLSLISIPLGSLFVMLLISPCEKCITKRLIPITDQTTAFDMMRNSAVESCKV